MSSVKENGIQKMKPVSSEREQSKLVMVSSESWNEIG